MKYNFCLACDNEQSPSRALSCLNKCWLPQKWVLFKCPACGDQAHWHVRNGSIALGYLDGGPGPCHIPERTLRLPGFRYAVGRKGLRLHWEAQSWFLRAA